MTDAFAPLGRDELKKRYGGFFERRTEQLDETKVPPLFRLLIPYAEIWGVGDDVYRDELVEAAPPAAKADLLALVREFDDQFDTWLAGPESYLRPHSAEYLAFSNMRMAFDYLSVLT